MHGSIESALVIDMKAILKTCRQLILSLVAIKLTIAKTIIVPGDPMLVNIIVKDQMITNICQCIASRKQHSKNITCMHFVCTATIGRL